MPMPVTAEAPIGQYLADLAKILAPHPAPWRMSGKNFCIIVDAHGQEVDACTFIDNEHLPWVVAAVNLAAGICP